ncbi:MAG: hypothetical protein A2V88_13845 [Elusimicrobia bacterium RBG_16_66_12]|nr:MAG: hypothetical protein A2V88_13845 [Elusimicrobia bacterium RBG_16_66_12]
MKSKNMKRRLLIVDDDSNTLDILSANLASPDWEIETALDAMSAFLKARETRPFLIITDIRMPTYGRGTDMLRALRKEKVLAKTPVIVLTGIGLEQARALMPQEDQNVRLLTKPPDFDALTALIREMGGLEAAQPSDS